MSRSGSKGRALDILGRPIPRRRTPGLFDVYVIEDGKRRRGTRAEFAEAYRLWAKHADVREGVVS